MITNNTIKMINFCCSKWNNNCQFLCSCFEMKEIDVFVLGVVDDGEPDSEDDVQGEETEKD